MIDLSQSPSASPLVHTVAMDPGLLRTKDAAVAIDAPPDAEVDPLPEVRWPPLVWPAGPPAVRHGTSSHSFDCPLAGGPASHTNPTAQLRTGICSAVSPRVLALPGGGYRMYYSQILPRRGFPAGANDYDNSTTRILSAFSSDGSVWTPESGVRLSAQAGGAGELRVVSSEVVPVGDGGRLRMYYAGYSQSNRAYVLRAVSDDGLT